MKNLAWISMTFAAALVGPAGIGCADGKYYQLGKTAEQKGDSAAAYDYYCRAGAKQRSGAVAGGLARTRADAAAQSERAGLAAMDQGRYDNAWRWFMRTLEIQPDHPTAAQLVRKLENEHSSEVAAARQEWLMHGALALGPSMREEIAAAESSPLPAPQKQPYSEVISSLASVPPARIPAPPPRIEAKESATHKKEAPKVPESAANPPMESLPRQSDSRPISPAGPGDYLAVHTLSLKDRRYPRMVIAVDGIGVKLKDTDSDGEVDMDLFDGTKRVQKVRDLELGRSQTFRGKSGELYRLTLIGVHHKSETVKIGVKRT